MNVIQNSNIISTSLLNSTSDVLNALSSDDHSHSVKIYLIAWYYCWIIGNILLLLLWVVYY